MPDEPIQSELRIFLSADLAGSTRLKNRLNHQELYEKFKARWTVLDKIREKNNGVNFSDEAAHTAVLESLGVSTEDFDWASVVEFFYANLHSEFSDNLAKANEKHQLNEFPAKVKPWKAVGDELIYQLIVRSRKDLHWITLAFLAAVRVIDGKVKDRGGAERGLRIKGSAWVAGFPVRNRKIRLPAIESEDFLGPDIDTGFRIGKCTQPGMLVVSMKLAELLSETPGEINPVVGKIVGWEELKGVWNDKKYPIVWVDFPSGYPRADDDLKAPKFDPWQQADSVWCKAWESNSPPKQPLREFMDQLREVRSSLPKSLGLVDPYIVGDPEYDDKVPEEHQHILELLKMVRDHQANVQKQGTEEVVGDAGGAEQAVEIEGLFQATEADQAKAKQPPRASKQS